MDITQLAISGAVALGMLVVALLAIVPTLSEELPGSHRRHDRSTDTPAPVTVRHHSVRP